MSVFEDERGTGDRGTSTAPFQNAAPPTVLDTVRAAATPVLFYAGCRLPAATVLHSGSDGKLVTREDGTTRASVQIRSTGLDVSFTPALRAETPFYARDVDFSGLSYSFDSGAITAIRTGASWDLFGAAETGVRGKIIGALHDVIDGTRIAQSGYDPFTDTDLRGTLESLNLSGSGGDLTANIDGCVLGAGFTLKSQFEQTEGDYGITAATGTRINVQVDFDSTLATLLAGQGRIATAGLGLEPGAALLAKGAAVAQLRSLTIHYGGRVEVSYTPLGAAAALEGGAALADLAARGAFFMVALGSGEPGKASDIASGPAVISGSIAKQINAAFTAAIDDLVRESRDAIPGVDLAAMVGLADSVSFDPVTVTGSPNRIVFDPIEFSAGSDPTTP